MATRRGFIGGSAAALIAGAAPRSAWGSTVADVAVIGAGLAGLAAARMLEAAGLKVIVLEGQNRIGGRLHTLGTLDGKPEAGGIQVGAGYTRLRRIAAELDVGLTDDGGAGAGRNDVPGNLYNIGGTSVPSAEWATSAANMLSADEKATEPASLLRKYAAALPRLSSPEAWLSADARGDTSVASVLTNAGASEEALRLIGANFNGNSLDEMSALHLARTFAIYRSQPGAISTIDGGSQRLPEAMAVALSNPVRSNVQVYAVFENTGDVALATSAGEIRVRQAVCTIPFSALRKMTLEAAPPPHVANMIGALPYTRASFAYLRARGPFWRDDGQPETLWTDNPMIGRVFVLGDNPPMLKVWTTGAGADLLDRMPPDEASKRIIAAIEDARPSARGQLRVEQLFSWQKQYGADGIYHHIGTGQAKALAETTRYEARRLHFAGEHMAQANSGMEGALESGERAALQVLARSA